MTNQHDQNQHAFDQFFPEERREDDTDPGMTIAAQPGAYVPANGGLEHKSLTAPLLAFGTALVGLAVVALLVVNNLTSSGPTQAGAPPSSQPAPTAPASQTASQTPSATPTPSSTTSEQPSSTQPSSTSSSESSSPSSSSSSSAAVLVSLPRSQTGCGSPTTYTTSSSVSCGFATSIYDSVRNAGLTDGQVTSFQVHSDRSEGGSGLTYDVSCTHQPGSFIACTGISEPDNGHRPQVFVMPTQG